MNYVRSRDAQKQLGRTSLSIFIQPGSGLEPGPLDPWSSALIIRHISEFPHGYLHVSPFSSRLLAGQIKFLIS